MQWATLPALGLLSAMAATAMPANLLTNPQVADNADSWHTWPRKGQPEFAFDAQTGHGDATSLRVTVRETTADGSWVQSLPGEGGTQYDYAFWFRTDPPGLQVAFLAEYAAADGSYAGQHLAHHTSEGGEWTLAEGSYVLPTSAVTMQYEVWVNLDGTGVGTAWFDDFSLVVSAHPNVTMDIEEPLFGLLGPGAGRIVCRFRQSNPHAPEVRCTTEVRLGEHVLVTRSAPLRREARLVLPVRGAPRDGSLMVASRAEAAGQQVFAAEDALACRASEPRVGVGRHRELVVEGHPFFPIGVYWAHQEDLADLAANGFNCVHGWQYPNEAGRAFFAEAQRRGLRVALEMSDTLRGQTDLAAIRERATAFRDEPALLCYYPVDEPSPPITDPAGLRQAYNVLKATDPDHPVMVVQCSMGYLSTYLGSSDIVAVDPYGSPDYVQQCMRQANDVSDSRRPVWAVLATFPWEGLPGWPGPPTAAYVRSAAYVALIGGAKAMLYFSYYFDNGFCLKNSRLWAPLGQLNAEITRLAPWLLACEPQPLETSDARVLAALFRRGDSAVVLAANKSGEEAVRATVRVPGYTGEAEGLLGSRTLRCDGKLRLVLGPHGTAAYVLPAQRGLGRL